VNIPVDGSDIKKRTTQIEKMDITRYLKEIKPLEFRTDFGKTIRDFKIFHGGLDGFKEIGTLSTTCLTIVYILIVLFKPDNIDTPEPKKIDKISKICEL